MENNAAMFETTNQFGFAFASFPGLQCSRLKLLLLHFSLMDPPSPSSPLC
jgi:hypothetical protein